MLFKKNKKTYLSIYQVEEMKVNGKDLDAFNKRKGTFGDIVIDLEPGTYEINGKFIMTKGKENQVSDEMKLNIVIKEGKNVISVSEKEKHFAECTPIKKMFNNNGEEMQFFVGILK